MKTPFMVVCFWVAGAALLLPQAGKAQDKPRPFSIVASLPITDREGVELEGRSPEDPLWDGAPGDLIQVISAGPDNQPDLIGPGGIVTGDDSICFTLRIGEGVLPGVTGRFSCTLAEPLDESKGSIYVRAYNSDECFTATCYGQSGLFPCSLSFSQDFDVSVSNLSATDNCLYQLGDCGFLFIGSDDYDGDGGSDPAIYDPETGTWEVRGIYTGLEWGGEEDMIPAAGDYDGDGTTEPAFFQDGEWYVWPDDEPIELGEAGEFPVPQDYDGDGTTDFATWSPEEGTWRALLSSRGGGENAEVEIIQEDLGELGDVPVPGDYTGDGTASPAVWRPSTAEWIVAGSKTMKWGYRTDIPVPLDADGDGALDLTTWRPRGEVSGLWITRDMSPISWGLEVAGDIPLAGDFDNDGADDIATWRPAKAKLLIYNRTGIKTRLYLGEEGETPVNRRCSL